MSKYFMYAALLLAGIASVPVLTQTPSISFSYVIDITGSMGNEIAAIQSTANSILSVLSGFSFITEYNLVKFQDIPLTLPSTTTTTAALAMIPAINAITVGGGGDCPENSMAGVLQALTISQPCSFIVGFTDASPNDLALLPTILSLISSTGSTVIFVLTGDCGEEKTIKPNDVASFDETHANDLHKALSDSEPVSAPSVGAPGTEAYYEIASASGGYVFAVDKNDVPTVLGSLTDLIVPSSNATGMFKVHLESLEYPTGVSNIESFFVDATLSDVIISVTGTAADCTVYDPVGAVLPGVILVDLPNAYVVKIPNPVPGTWYVQYSSTSANKLLITGTSSIDFKYEFNDVGTGNVISQPMTGTTLKVNIKIIGGGSYSTMIIQSFSGSALSTSTMTSTGLNTYCSQPFVVPGERFHIHVYGSGLKGRLLERITKKPITPLDATTTAEPTTKTTPPTRPPNQFSHTPCQNSTGFYGTCQMNDLPCPDGKYVDGLCRDPNNKHIKWIQREIYRSCCIVGSDVGY